MTSTRFNIGLSDNTRSSSRVLRPPGGGHTDIFGGEAEPQRGRRPAPAVLAAQAEAAAIRAQTINGTADSQPAQAAPEPAQPAPEPAQNGHQTPDAPEPQSQPQTPPEPKVVTPPSKEEIQPEPARVEPPKRVRVPPGGFSSGLW